MADFEQADVGGGDELTAAMAEVDAQGAGDIAPSAQPASTSSGSAPAATQNEYEAYIQRMLDEENGVGQSKKQPEEDDSKVLEGIDPKSGAAQRIQTLANQRKDAEARATQAAQQVEQLQNAVQSVQQQAAQYVNRLQADNHKLATQLAEVQGQMKILSQHVNPQQQQPDDATRLKNEWLGEAKNVFNEVLTPMQKQLEESRQRYENYINEQETTRLSTQYQEQTKQVALDIALKGLPSEDAQKLAPLVTPQILAVMMHTGMKADQAARVVRQSYMQFGLGLVRAQSRAATEALKKGQQVPSAAPSNRRVNGGGQALPSLRDIQAAGFTNELDPEFMARQR